MLKNCVFAAVFGLLLICGAEAQERLTVSADNPEIDGIISDGEYSLVVELPRGALYLNRTEQLLCIAVQSELDGWVAVGLGSTRMDQASIYIGYVDSAEKIFARQRGRGHSHADAAATEPREYQLNEGPSGTILELSFAASAFTPAGSATLNMIVACGKRDNLRSYHSMRRGLEIGL